MNCRRCHKCKLEPSASKPRSKLDAFVDASVVTMQTCATCKQLNGISGDAADDQLVMYVADMSCMLHCKAAPSVH